MSGGKDNHGNAPAWAGIDSQNPVVIPASLPSSNKAANRIGHGKKPKFVPKIPVKKEPPSSASVVCTRQPSEGTSDHNTTTSGTNQNGANRRDQGEPNPLTGSNRKQHDSRNHFNKGSNWKSGSKYRGGRGSHNHRGDQRNGYEPGVSRRWVMPTGVPFFTGITPSGGSSSAGPSAVMSSGGQSRQLPGVFGKGSVSTTVTGVAGGVRAGGTISGKSMASSAVKVESNVPGDGYGEAMVDDVDEEEYDSDDMDTGEQNGESCYDQYDETGAIVHVADEEAWPPKRYMPWEPVALPLGPKSHAMRVLLTNQAVLAEPSDEFQLLQEESSSLFVVQLPNDLRFEKLLAGSAAPYTAAQSSQQGQHDGYDDAAIDETATEQKAHRGSHSGSDRARKIGKMQLLRSGRVRLVAEDGRVYEVNSGVASSFVQILSSIDTPAPAASVKSEATTTATAAADTSNGSSSNFTGQAADQRKRGSAATTGGGGGASASAAATAGPGSIHLMGSVSKKIVVTPCYDLGVRRPRSYSGSFDTSSNSHNTSNLSDYAVSGEIGSGSGDSAPASVSGELREKGHPGGNAATGGQGVGINSSEPDSGFGGNDDDDDDDGDGGVGSASRAGRGGSSSKGGRGRSGRGGGGRAPAVQYLGGDAGARSRKSLRASGSQQPQGVRFADES